MIYNRYIPESNGIYKKHCVVFPDAEPKPVTTDTSKKQDRECPTQECGQPNPRFGWDLGDLLLLCIVILLLLDSEEGDMLPILIAAAAFLFLQ